jgi:hypothetical protein
LGLNKVCCAAVASQWLVKKKQINCLAVEENIFKDEFGRAID